MKRTWRRRNYFIKKDLQGKYIFIFFIFVIAGSYLFTAILGLMSSDTLTMVYKDHNLHLGKTPVVLLRELLRAHWIFIVTGGVLVVLVSVFLTHRFAGPLYRFEKSVEEMSRGNFNFEIRLRSGDEAKELAEMLNGFNTGISSRLREAREQGHIRCEGGNGGFVGEDGHVVVASPHRCKKRTGERARVTPNAQGYPAPFSSQK